MITIRGTGVSRGIAGGPLRFFRRAAPAAEPLRAEDPARERERLERARKQTVCQLEELARQCRTRAREVGTLFETHAMLAEDEDFTAGIDALLEEGFGAEYAVQQAGEEFAALFAALEDPYMRERAADIRDVARRIRDNLMGGSAIDIRWTEPVILAADDLAPSETLQLDPSAVLAFVTRGGSVNSHTAILARTMGIPAMCGAGEALREDFEGRLCYIDGESGELIVDPDPMTRAALQERLEAQQERNRLLENLRGKADVTLDGQTMQVCCNIGSSEDVDVVLRNDGRGIGLFRSEFLYLQARDYPSEEEQFQVYRRVAEAMNGKRVVIRTLDIGSDKQVDYFGLKREENPALGLRGIRVCLNRPELLRTQLRALYRASAYGNMAILFPMITSVWEVKACKQACKRVMDELEREGVAFNRDTEIGIMIETPAAVWVADALAREVDFFSVGTNDLTQYTLACDRQAGHLGPFLDPHHPAVLRGLKMAADAAHKAGIWIGICGELGADLDLLPTFLAMGIDELSVSPAEVLPLRAAIRQSTAKTCTLEKLDC